VVSFFPQALVTMTRASSGVAASPTG